MRKALYLAALAIAAFSTACTQEQADDDSSGDSQDTSQEMRRPRHHRTVISLAGGSGGAAGTAGSSSSGTGGTTSAGGASGEGGSTAASGGSAGVGGSTSSEGGSAGVGGSAGAGAGGLSGVFASCPVKLPVAGMANPTSPSLGKPARGAVLSEPTFGTCMARATDHVADGLQTFARNDYSRREPFNADNSRYLVYSGDGGWYLYDASTLQKIKELPAVSGDAEPQWHPTDPNKLYYLPTNGGLKVFLLDVTTNTSQVAADFTGKLPWSGAAHVWTKSEGSPSRDARYWGFMVQNSSYGNLGYIVWDMQLGQLAGSMTSSAAADHVSMSPSGRWMTISFDDGTYAYSRDFATKKQLHTTSEHSDIAIAANGDDLYVSIDYGSDAGEIFMVDLDTGVRTALTPTYLNGSATAMHFSGKAFGKPGWVLISTYSNSGSPQWLSEKVFALQLAANPKVYELAFHHSLRGDEYFAEPHAAVSRDFSRILFSSNWDKSGSSDIEAYMLALPAGAF